MKTFAIYRCLCDETRLRLLNLLLEGPLCVCHLAEVLDMEQPKISRHLKALKAAEAVTSERCYNWTIYRLAAKPNPVLEANLKCLQDLRGEEPQFAKDLKRRARALAKINAAKCGDLPDPIRCLS